MLPFDFVLDELAGLDTYIKPMFGAYGVYIGPQIYFILRDRESNPQDNGIWIAVNAGYHESLRQDLPSMRDIALFGPGPTGWQVLPKEADDFEESCFKLCEMIKQGDVRIGKTPQKKLTKKKSAKKKFSKKIKRNQL